jgi:hypothetical protein
VDRENVTGLDKPQSEKIAYVLLTFQQALFLLTK